MSIQPSAHPRVTWQIFGAVSALAGLAVLVATVPSGDRATIVLAVWCWLIGTTVTGAFVNAWVHPLPFEARGLTTRGLTTGMHRGYDAGGATAGDFGGDFGGGDCGGGGGDCG